MAANATYPAVDSTVSTGWSAGLDGALIDVMAQIAQLSRAAPAAPQTLETEAFPLERTCSPPARSERLARSDARRPQPAR